MKNYGTKNTKSSKSNSQLSHPGATDSLSTKSSKSNSQLSQPGATDSLNTKSSKSNSQPSHLGASASLSIEYLKSKSPNSKKCISSESHVVPDRETPIHKINSLSDKVSLPHIFLKTEYSETPICFLIDTGASVSIAKLINFTTKPKLSTEKIKIKGLSDNDVKPSKRIYSQYYRI